MKLATTFLFSLLLVSCSHYSNESAIAIQETETVSSGRKIASLVDSDNLKISQIFTKVGKQEAIEMSQRNCVNAGGVALRTSVWSPEQIKSIYWQAATICLMQNSSDGPATTNNDPNAKFCYLRSTPQKCGEIGVCEWIAPKSSLCKVRAGFESDPNSKFCYLRSTPEKCDEIGACEFVASERAGHCQAR